MQALGVEAQEKATARAERFRGQAAMLEETVAQQQQSLRSVVASLEADVAAERARGGVIGALLQGELTADDAYAASREQVWFHAVTCRYTSYVRLLAPRRESYLWWRRTCNSGSPHETVLMYALPTQVEVEL